MDKGNQGKGVYIPCWNVHKSNRLTSMEEKKDWVDNIMPPAARAKFDIYKEMELDRRLDHSIYEVNC